MVLASCTSKTGRESEHNRCMETDEQSASRVTGLLVPAHWKTNRQIYWLNEDRRKHIGKRCEQLILNFAQVIDKDAGSS